MNKLLITLKNPRHFPFSIHILLKVVENYCLTLIKPALGGFKAVKIVKMSVNNPESLKRSNMMETTVDQINPVADDCSEGPSTESVSADYSFVTAVARIALYDDLRSAPRVTEIQPAETGAYIDGLAAQVYEQARQSGGTIPYTVVREVSENFIHARFKEIIVSILDHGNTIRFADQGPGISFKDKAQLPGFSSAIEPMKSYIRGVGSGLPIVKEYLEFSHGTISIEDNMGSGSVVTISVDPDRVKAGEDEVPPFDERAAEIEYQRSLAAEAAEPQAAAWDDPRFGGSAAAGAYPAAMPQGGPSPAIAQPAAPYVQPGFVGAPAGAYPGAVMPRQNPAMNGFQSVPQGYPTTPLPQAGVNPAYYAQPAYGAGAYGSGAYDGYEAARVQTSIAALSQRERDFLPILLHEGALGVTELSKLTDAPTSSTYVALRKLEEAGLVETTAGQKRLLTHLGRDVASCL